MASAGRVLLMPKGTWTANTAYSELDFVYYGGNSYVCKAAVSGTTDPASDTTHWQLMASGFDSDLITQTITNDPNHIASDAAVYAECQKLEAADNHFREDFASVEASATSALVYSAGDYLMYQDQLYKATTDIAVGDPLVSGTNIRAVTVGEEMADLAASGASNTTAISQYAADMASVETSTSASKAYSVGEYLMLAGQLYKVTAAIASGGTLEVGTNISAVNLGDQLKSLSDSLNKYTDYNASGHYHIRVAEIGKMVCVSGTIIKLASDTGAYLTAVRLPQPALYNSNVGGEYNTNAVIFRLRDQTNGNIVESRCGSDFYIAFTDMTIGNPYAFAFAYCKE